jgi:hypothetical protein
MPACKVSAVCCEKLGNAEIDNEDAYLVPSQFDIDNTFFLNFAVADGATESSFSKEWADLLVSYFDNFLFDSNHLPLVLDKVRNSWLDKIKGIELPWYAQEKAQYGSHAALLGLTLDLSVLSWGAIAIGDSNLFVVRDNELIKAFPIQRPEDFSSAPYLLSTDPAQYIEIESKVLRANGNIRVGDILVIGTDAISAWFLSEAIGNNRPWLQLQDLLGNTRYSKIDFIDWLNHKRAKKEIKNDDTTVIIIEIE